MKILFINPCLRRGAKLKILPVGLACVMTYVREQGFNFDLYDIDILEPSDVEVENFIRDNKYDVILYGSIVTHYAWIKWLTHTIKKYHPTTTTIIGNSVAASCVDVFMENSPADIVVHGEGELTCVDALRALKGETDLYFVPGITFRDPGGQVIKTPKRKACDIDTLPMPDWELFDIDTYRARSTGTTFGSQKADVFSMPVSTARGCAFRCSFCHFVFWEDSYRYRNPDAVMTEIRRNIEYYGANYFNFWDDLSFGSIRQLERMLDAIEESNLEFEWSAAIRTDLFGREKLDYSRRLEIAKRMRRLGCTAVGYSLESANQDILKMMNKRVEPEYFLEQVDILRNADIVSNVSVVFGYPIENSETIQETFDMCFKARIYPSIGYLLPLPATGMYTYAVENGYITDEDAYLTSITERQDLCLNMTKLADDDILGQISSGASELNRKLEIGLKDENLIKTGGYIEHTSEKNQAEDSVSDKLTRNENDFSFNYSQSEFDLRTNAEC